MFYMRPSSLRFGAVHVKIINSDNELKATYGEKRALARTINNDDDGLMG